MREFRIKQKKLYKLMKILILCSVILIFVYVGIQPFIAAYSNILALTVGYICDGFMVIALAVIVTYYTKYSKADSFLSRIEYELSDAGYYFTSRNENTADAYINVMSDDFKNCSFSLDKKAEAGDFDFDLIAYKKKEYMYVVDVDDLDKNDIVAYSDAAIRDITENKLKRKGSTVVCFITNKAQKDAIAISKVITSLGNKEQLKFTYAIVELSTHRVYFLGNMVTKCQQLTANFVMNCDVPIKDEYIGKERLEFQDELEEHMKSFDIVLFKNGTFTDRFGV